MTCPFCSTFNDHDAHYCKQCGTHLSTAQRDIFSEPRSKEEVSDTGYLWIALIAVISTLLYSLVFPFVLRYFSGSLATIAFYRGVNIIFLLAEFGLLVFFTRNNARRTAITWIGVLLLIFNLVTMFGFLNL